MLTGQALLDDMRRRSADENEHNRLSTVFLVEATDYEATFQVVDHRMVER